MNGHSVKFSDRGCFKNHLMFLLLSCSGKPTLQVQHYEKLTKQFATKPNQYLKYQLDRLICSF
ncbi:hypothetical protein BH18THE2_BH18THE2_22330 [soil metagenome]